MGGQEGKRRGLSEVYSVWGFSSHLLGEFVSLLIVLYNARSICFFRSSLTS